MECDSASNAPKCLLNNGVFIVQKLLSNSLNTSTTGGNNIVTFNVVLTITNAD